MMRITNGCITDSTRPTKQLNLSVTSTQQETGTISTTDTETSTLGSYYNSIVALLTDDCGIGAFSVATGKAVAYGIVGGLWGATEGSFYGLFSGDRLEGLVIGSMVG
jgi:carbohydrate-binding DOMON domain-containing protein